MTSPRPNVVLLHCHDLGRFLGSYGIDTVRTPHLDRLGEEGVRFTQAFATAPQCSPARAALVTGTYPQKNGVMGLTHMPFGWDLNDPSDHLATRLGSAGYQTALLGVHHESLVLDDAQVMERLGFTSVATGGIGEVVAARAESLIDDYAASCEPFYLQVGFYEPHRTPSHQDADGVMGFLGDHITPDDSLGVTVPDYLDDDQGARAEIAELQSAVAYMDAQVGTVLDALERNDLARDTLVIFTTDHGLALPRAKCSLYEPGLEVALIMRAPWRAKWASRQIDSFVTHLDVRPTVNELLGLDAEESADGTSLVPLVEDGRGGSRLVFGQMTHHDYYDPKRSVRSATHKLIVNFSSAHQFMDPSQSWYRRTRPHALRTSTTVAGPDIEFYDLRSDPGEVHNLADSAEMAGTIDEFAAAMLSWMAWVGDPLLDGAVVSPQHARAISTLREKGTGARGGP